MCNHLDRFRDVLAERFCLRRELGRGGMSVVYLAEDRRLGRPVALKVLRPEHVATTCHERFLSEIEMLAQLQHPHILPLYESGEAARLDYYTMPYFEGETLRATLKREGRLPLSEVVAAASAIGRALDYAHRHQVIHRDIKPENILLYEGLPIVMDFGIAFVISGDRQRSLTAAGQALGTAHYMSPEQASGDSAIDGRSDIYSLACVVYEMLSGDPPFPGCNLHSIMARHVGDEAPALSTVRQDTRPGVCTALSKALSKDPSERFATAGEFAAALCTTEPRRRHAAGHDAIAVLPFANLSGEPDNVYFTDSITEEITSALTQFRGLRVAARTSASVFNGRNRHVRDVGECLNVGAVLEGSVRRIGGNLRVTAQLVNVETGHRVWSARYDREASDDFAVQDEIAAAIVTKVVASLQTSVPAPRATPCTDQLPTGGARCAMPRQRGSN